MKRLATILTRRDLLLCFPYAGKMAKKQIAMITQPKMRDVVKTSIGAALCCSEYWVGNFSDRPKSKNENERVMMRPKL